MLVAPKWRRRTAVLCCLFAAACQPETSTVETAGVLTHENGLIINRPKLLQATKTGTGFAMIEAGENRSPLTLTIELVPDHKKPTAVYPKWFGLFGLRQRIEKIQGGSGGDEYQLTATYQLKNCWLVLSASQQSETGEPNFLEAWAVLDYASGKDDLTCAR